MIGYLHTRDSLVVTCALVAVGCGLAPLQRPAVPPAATEIAPVAAAAVVDLSTPRVGAEGLRTLQGHPTVSQRVEHMLGRGRITLRTSLKRSVAYVPMIEEQLGEHGVPAELAYLPMVESRFRPNAVGRRAVGMWQFTRSTARLYGLTVNRKVDERRDPEKSSRAAARYLRDLYDQFESWDLALAAYNAGPGRVRRALKKRPEANFFELADRRLLPRITRGYVPKVLAISLIGPKPGTYGLEVPVARAAARRTDVGANS